LARATPRCASALVQRFQTYLAAGRGSTTAAEFQKILDHSGIGCRRHKDFLTLWKDADPDIPILKEAKAEYARLQ
jgi:hypothetical protein